MSIVIGCASQQDVVTLDNLASQLRQDYTNLQKRISALEQRNAELTAKVDDYGKGRENEDKNLRQQAAALRILVDELRAQARKLRGRIDESEYAIKQKAQSLEEQEQKNSHTLADNQGRIARIEQYLNLEINAPEPEPEKDAAKPTESPPAKALSEEALYKAAKLAFDRKDLETALDEFQKFIKRYPKSKNADNAQFWIGEIYYREKWYEKAILEYQKVIENYPQGNKVQASLLKQGFAFFKIGDKANGRLILKELVNKYPKSAEAKIARKRIKGAES